MMTKPEFETEVLYGLSDEIVPWALIETYESDGYLFMEEDREYYEKLKDALEIVIPHWVVKGGTYDKYFQKVKEERNEQKISTND